MISRPDSIDWADWEKRGADWQRANWRFAYDGLGCSIYTYKQPAAGLFMAMERLRQGLPIRTSTLMGEILSATQMERALWLASVMAND